MGNYITKESADLFDPTTGAWVGVVDMRGREQVVLTSAQAAAIAATDGLVVPVTVTGTTATKTFLVKTIPSEVLLSGAYIIIRAMFSGTGAGAKTYQIGINDGLGGATALDLIYSVGGLVLQGAMMCEARVFIRDEALQISGELNSYSGLGNTSSPPVLTAKNTKMGLDIIFQGALISSADTMSLETVSFEVHSK